LCATSGTALAAMINARNEQLGIRATAQATGASVYNINAVLSGDLDFGIAQSDTQYRACEGLVEWEKRGGAGKLRSVCSLHPEAVTLVAADDSGINTVKDLKGKRVNIGNPGSGQRQNAVDILRAVGLDWQSDIQAESMKAGESAKVLQDGRIDAFFFTVGHPAGAITEATAGRKRVHFVPVTGMTALLQECPYFAETVIPVSYYPSATNAEDVPTIGVMTTMVTSADVSDDVVYKVTKTLFENLDEFKAKHQAFANLTPEEMITKGLTAPFHPGALRYFTETGLLEKSAPSIPSE